MRAKLKLLCNLALIITLSSCAQKLTLPKFKFFSDYNSTPTPIKKDINVALVLGGGGARGMAHVGVIEVLEKNNIHVDLIVGASAGSVVGAFYSDNPSAENLKSKMLKIKKGDLLDFSIVSFIHSTYTLKGSVNGSSTIKFINDNLQAKLFQDLKIPLIAVATDIKTGDIIGIRSGPIAPAILASCALPGLFTPVNLYDMTLVDGGVSSPLPVHIAKQYRPKIIIAVDISVPVRDDPLNNAFDIMYKSLSITYFHLSKNLANQADILIRPDVMNIGMFDDDQNQELYEAGKKAAEEQIPAIKAKMKENTSLIKKIFSSGKSL
jgi:NTE family protein